MTKDPIVEEVRTARQKLFDACGGNLDALLNYLKEREQQDRSRVVSPETVRARQITDQGMTGCEDVTSISEAVPENEP